MSSVRAKKMTKKALRTRVRDQTGMTEREVTTVLDTALELIVESVRDGGSVSIHGFGRFFGTDRTVENGENMESIERHLRFRPSRALKNRLGGRR